MRIKKNGKTFNLTESDIRKLSKTLLKEQDISLGDTEGFKKDLQQGMWDVEKAVQQAKSAPTDTPEKKDTSYGSKSSPIKIKPNDYNSVKDTIKKSLKRDDVNINFDSTNYRFATVSFVRNGKNTTLLIPTNDVSRILPQV
jgi:hypothetical protein